MPLPPPPYSGSPSNGYHSPSLFHPSTMTPPPAALEPHQLVDPSDMYSWSRSFPAPPEPVDPIDPQVPASKYQFPSRITASPPPLPSSRSFATASTSSHHQSYPLPPLPPLPPPKVTTISLPTPPRSRSLSATKSRSPFPFSASKLSKATRNATAWFSEHSARKGTAEVMLEDEQRKRSTVEPEAAATRIRTEEDSWQAVIRGKASEAVKSSMQSLLSRNLPNEEWNTVLQKCGQICANGGLDLSVVLQEPLIDGKPPVYWAILNRPAMSLQNSDVALHALVLSLLDLCQPLKETTIASIRLACMLTSNNPLLQHLFWNSPALSPLTRSDTMLLGSAGGGDIVDVDETRDGTGTFIARIQIRRFRLRMRVSKLVKVEFVTSGRPAQAFVQVAP
jgi:hypothetical protein